MLHDKGSLTSVVPYPLATCPPRLSRLQVKPQEETALQERAKVDDIRGTPMGVSTLEEMVRFTHPTSPPGPTE